MSTHGTGPDAAFRRLVERLFLRHHRGEQEHLLVGSLPPEWDLPLPVGAVVLGSLPGRQTTRAAVDVPGEPEQAVAEVERLLTARGWRMQYDTILRRSGFVSSSDEMRMTAARLLCDDARRRYLNVTAAPGDGGMADLHLTLDSDPERFTTCEAEEVLNRRPMFAFPTLLPPPGVRQQGSSRGGGRWTLTACALLSGSLPPDAIEPHYREQLAAAGWRAGEYAASGRWAWSTWEFTDGEGTAWTALLTVVAPPGQDAHREATLQAARSGPIGGSWASG